MFKKIYSKLPLSGLALLTMVNAESGERIDALEARVSQLSQENTQNTVGQKNLTTRNQGYASGVFIETDFLYWQAIQDGLEYALSSHSPIDPLSILGPGPAEISSGHLKEIDFDWTPGFRLGIGYNFAYDQWDLFLNWTRFNNHSTDDAKPRAGGSLSALWIPTTLDGGDTQKASAHWHIRYDIVDLELGRSFYLSKGLSARPFVGLRGAFIGQHARFRYDDVHFTNSPTFFDMTCHTKNEFNAWGLRGGTDLNFRFNQHWSLYGAGSVSLLYGEFDVKLGLQAKGMDLGVKPGYKSHFHRTQSNLQGAIGLQWETGTSHERYHLTFLACYEFAQWFNQNQLFKLMAPSIFNPALQANDGDLSLQGGTLSMRFDF